MNVIIPVAGEGVRLKPHTHFLPKCLLYVAGKPILGHILEGLKSLNVSKVIIVLGKKSDSIVQFCKNYQFDFKFVVQKERLGLGHAIYLGARDVSGPTLVLLGDTIVDYDLKKFACGAISKLAVKEVDEPKRFGVVEIDGGYVKSVVEKPEEPKSNLAIVGLYYFADSKRVFWAMSNIIKKKIMTKNEYQLTDGLSFLLRRGEKFLAIRVKNWFDCGTPEALIKTNQHLLKKSHYCHTRRGCVIIKPVYIPDSVEINDSVIGPFVSIGDGVKIKNSIIQNSIINNDSMIENTMLTNSIIGQNAMVRGNFKKLNVGDFSVIELP